MYMENKDRNVVEEIGKKNIGNEGKKSKFIYLIVGILIGGGLVALADYFRELPQDVEPQEELASETDLIEDFADKTITVNGVLFKMVAVGGGKFMMGNTPEQGRDATGISGPVHRVTLSDYYIAETEVTQELFEAVMGYNPSRFKEANLPVETVSWELCQAFVEELNKLTGKTFRLPTEAEWEFAARGGNESKGYKYSGGNDLQSVAWYGNNSGIKTHDVKLKQPNELGLFDMSGNVCEWCQDRYGPYSDVPMTDPTGPAEPYIYRQNDRITRGGDCYYDEQYCRSSYRNSYLYNRGNPNIGFRLCASSL